MLFYCLSHCYLSQSFTMNFESFSRKRCTLSCKSVCVGMWICVLPGYLLTFRERFQHLHYFIILIFTTVYSASVFILFLFFYLTNVRSSLKLIFSNNFSFFLKIQISKKFLFFLCVLVFLLSQHVSLNRIWMSTFTHPLFFRTSSKKKKCYIYIYVYILITLQNVQHV
jgi:hypothetical protein